MNCFDKAWQEYEDLQSRYNNNVRDIYRALKVAKFLRMGENRIIKNDKISPDDLNKIYALDMDAIYLIDYSKKYKLTLEKTCMGEFVAVFLIGAFLLFSIIFMAIQVFYFKNTRGYGILFLSCMVSWYPVWGFNKLKHLYIKLGNAENKNFIIEVLKGIPIFLSMLPRATIFFLTKRRGNY